MSKRIVFCCDGTWDSSASNSNVYRLYKSLAITASQIPYYDDGVGADGLPIEKLLGGAFGVGLFQKIKDGYTRIAHTYEAGDEVFLFGFSRGAYTARSLAGMIAVCGLPTANFDDGVVETAFQAYRDRDERQRLLANLSARYAMGEAKITMVGVWDTVGSLGIPALVGGVSPLVCGFLDTSLHPNVRNAYQALSIDERRMEFPPTLWTSSPVPGQVLEQVWFCGVHCDVGGGYADDSCGTALSDITLAWMMAKAGALGLVFDAAVQAKYAVPMDPKYALDQLHESWTPLWAFPRKRTVASNATLANSVDIRCRHDGSYRPENLAFSNGALSGSYQLATCVAGEPAIPSVQTTAAGAGTGASGN